MRTRTITIILLLPVMALMLDSCRPRSSRSTAAKKKTTTQKKATPTASSLNAKQVMNRADSVLANIGAIANEDDYTTPRVQPGDWPPQTPRTPWGAPYVPIPDNSAYGMYEAGLASFNAGRFNEAINAFSHVAISGRPPELIPNAYYWIGESFFAQNRYAESLPYFEYTTRAGLQYKRESAFYKLALANNMIGNNQAASLWSDRLRAEFPRSTYTSKLQKLGIR